VNVEMSKLGLDRRSALEVSSERRRVHAVSSNGFVDPRHQLRPLQKQPDEPAA